MQQCHSKGFQYSKQLTRVGALYVLYGNRHIRKIALLNRVHSKIVWSLQAQVEGLRLLQRNRGDVVASVATRWRYFELLVGSH